MIADDCGQLLNAVIKLDPQNEKASLSDFSIINEPFCDLGTNELNANFDIQIFSQNNKLVLTKSIFLNLLTVYESLDAKNLNRFGKNKVLASVLVKNIKFSIKMPLTNLEKYKIILKTNHKVFGEGDIK